MTGFVLPILNWLVMSSEIMQLEDELELRLHMFAYHLLMEVAGEDGLWILDAASVAHSFLHQLLLDFELWGI